MKPHNLKRSTLSVASAFFITLSAFSQKGADSGATLLYKAFQNPGNAARPRVWWHWMNGNITKDGIHKDLLWMHRSGIGGFQNFDAAMLTPRIVDQRLVYMTPEWKEAFRLATRLADSLKLEMAIAGSPGWSESGGPWVPAKDGMKKLVWREVRVTGGQPFRGVLPRPFTTTGAFQNLPVQEPVGLSPKTAAPPEYYGDVAVVAYRLPAADRSLSELSATVSSSGGSFDLAQLTDGDLVASALLPRDSAAGFAWIRFGFPRPQTIKGLTMVGGGLRDPFGIMATSEQRHLEASDDGVNFHPVAAIPAGGVPQQTVSFPPVTARYFRVRVQNPPAPSGRGGLLGGGQAPAGTEIAEIVLHPVTRIHHAEEKAGFAATYDLEKFPTPPSDDVVGKEDIIDLTGKMSADGTLDWTPPAGRWKVIRFGYSLTGKKNHPASPEATGLEVDKLDASAVKEYFATYLGQYKEATGGLMGSRGLNYLITDSWEAGQSTWTPRMAEEFRRRRGYALLPWMPVLTGTVVQSAEESERFLWDWRKTVAELVTENHYDGLTELLKRYGMKRYSESHENGRVFIADGMDVKRTAAVPMSAMWVPTGMGSTLEMAQADIRESASVAHIYGQNLVAAESLTTVGMMENAWGYHPANLKPTA
ncbi:MAG TPA: glycosyl hydrolase, partial [Chitinophagaceae bacterium]|nr:glycosyl hydrolase [Chitinophagaceae bacterium]